MKRTLVTLIFAIAITVAAAGATSATSYIPDNFYPQCGVVTEVDSEKDIVTFETFTTGILWSFYGAEDWQPGDVVAAIMDDNNTDLIFDDEIVTVRYCGYIEQ